MARMDANELRELGQQFRVDSIRPAAVAKSGHPTSGMSAADLMAVLVANHLRYDYGDPKNADLPVRGVTIHEARAFAEWRSKTKGGSWRLPTDHEWEVAAGWDPGTGRALPPLSRADTVAQMKIWIDGGAACPQ